MKITVQNLSNSFNRSFDLSSPGATFGRSPENQIVLPDPSASISLFQAALKINESSQIEIRNLAATPILVGNQSLSVGQSLVLQNNSEFSCGDFRFRLTTAHNEVVTSPDEQTTELNNPSFRAPTVMPMPGSESVDCEQISIQKVTSIEEVLKSESSPHNIELDPIDLKDKASTTPLKDEESVVKTLPEATNCSIFDDLFSGNGVAPIGAEVNHELHPFEMNSAIARNTDNPLEEMQGVALDEDLSKDPLERLSRDGIEHQQRDIFHDTRPSTLIHDSEQGASSKQTDLDHLDKILSELENLANSK